MYDIITPDNRTQPPAYRWRDFSGIVRPNTLFFWSGQQDEESYDDDGITVDLTGQFVKQLDEDGWLLQPSNIEIRIDFQTVKLKFSGASITQAIMVGEDEGEDEADAILDELRHFFDRLLIKQVGREVGMVNRIEFPDVLHREPGNNTVRTLHRNLNPNVKSVIASFLTGKRGSIGNQSRKLKENVVASLAPRPRRRKTRRSNRA